MGIFLGFFSVVHLLVFRFLWEGLLLAAVVSYFAAFGCAYSRRWLLPWMAALVAGVFVRGQVAVAFAILLHIGFMLATPLLLARGGWNRFKSLVFFILGLVASGVVLLFASPLWRAVVPHPFGIVTFGYVIPTPVDWPWYFVGYYIWERVHSLYRGWPKSWRVYFTYREG